jgi:hypothetical protein
VNILDIEWISWVEICNDAAVIIGTELKLSELLNSTLFRSCVEASGVVAISKAVLKGECIAFTLLLS